MRELYSTIRAQLLCGDLQVRPLISSLEETHQRTARKAMLADASRNRRRKAIERLLKIQLQNYPEHVVAQAIRVADKALTADPASAFRAILAGEQHAQARMASVPPSGAHVA